MSALSSERPNWRDLSIHESSPCQRGVSAKLSKDCPGYVASQFFADTALGAVKDGVICQDIERQTFPSLSFDIVITQDVMEHVFDPDAAHLEIWRTLKPGGVHIFTTPVSGNMPTTSRRAERSEDGKITHLFPPEYHGNPIDDAGSLVTFLYGYDIADNIARVTPFDVEVRRYNDRKRGILGLFTEVIICRKR